MKYLKSHEFKKYLAKGQNRDEDGAILGMRKDITSKPVVNPDNTITFVCSSDAIDRENDRVKQDGIDLTNFKLNPIVFLNHQSLEPPIGRAVSVGIVNGKLTATLEFIAAKAE